MELMDSINDNCVIITVSHTRRCLEVKIKFKRTGLEVKHITVFGILVCRLCLSYRTAVV